MMRCLFALVMLLSFLVSTGWSQTPFEPFEDTFDGPIDDDDPVTWVGAVFTDFFDEEVTTILEVVNGDLKVSNAAQLDPTPVTGFSLGLTFAMTARQASAPNEKTSSRRRREPPSEPRCCPQ